jgi:hypothetical protein
MRKINGAAATIMFLATTAVAQNAAAPGVRYDASTPRQRQIELAASAAPAEASSKAAIYVLGSHGYEKVREGSNGFSCLVGREYVTTQEPECFDAEGSQTILLTHLRVEELRSQGKSESDIKADIEAGYKAGRFIAPRKPGIVYMMSKENWVFDPESKKVIHFPGHLMFYAPYMTAKDLGYQKEASLPYLVHPGAPDTLMIVVPQSAAPSSSGASPSAKHQH